MLNIKRKVIFISISFLIFGPLLSGCSSPNNINPKLVGIDKNNFKNNMEDLRKPVVAGQFYTADKEKLKEQINNFLEQANSQKVAGRVKAIMVPHAGYDFSGPVAAEAYRQLEGTNIKTLVIIGNSHSSFFEGVAIDSSSSWQTPLGSVSVDTQFAHRLADNYENIIINGEPHKKEHSLEVQIPFLQTILGKDFKIVPILFGNIKDETECRNLAEALAANLGSNDLVIASSDMSHFPSYEDANRLDKRTLQIIKSADVEELEEHISTSMGEGVPHEETLLCGEDAVKTIMYLNNIKQWDSAKILRYSNSGDSDLGDKNRVVGYGAMVFADSTVKQEEVRQQESFSVESLEQKLGGLTVPLFPKEKKALLNIANESVESYIKKGVKPEFNITDKRLQEKEGAFVTLKKNGQLRGCIGQIVQTKKSLWEVVQDTAISAATSDDRFIPVSSEELSELTYEISVLSVPFQIDDWQQVQPGKHGVIIRQGNRSGVFLPQVAEETGWSREEFLSQLCSQKLVSTPDCYTSSDSEIFVFTAQVFSEKEQ